MRILVTGGAGFIGSHLCERLLAENHKIVVVDDLNDFYAESLKLNNLATIRKLGSFHFHQCDIRDREQVRMIVGDYRPEAVIHLAARAGVRPSLVDPLLYESVNVGGTTVLLDACREFSVRKFVFASSSSIYGIANTVPFREDDNLNLPISPYAATKIAAEKMCYTYSHLYKLRVTCLRFFTVYGPRQRPDLAIRKFIERIDDGKPIPVFGDGSSGRDYTYVDDTVSGISTAIDFDSPFAVFNLGNSHPISLRAMIETIEQSLGKKAIIEWRPEQPGDVPTTYADISRAQRFLGYAPTTSFQKGIVQTVNWYRRTQTLIGRAAKAS